MHFFMRLLPFIVVFLAGQALCQDCYFPDGTLATNYKSCANNGGTCCYHLDDNHIDLCYNNGLCWSTYFGSVYRGACTNKDWSGCTSQCTDVGRDVRYLMTSCDDRKICCGNYTQAADCCSAGEGTDWRNATIVNLAEIVDEAALAGPTTTSSPTQSSDSTASQSSDVTTLPIGAQGCSTEATSDPSFGAGIGVGLGIGLGVAVITMVLWCLLGRVRTKKAEVPDMKELPAGHSLSHKSLTAAPVEIHYDHSQELESGLRPELSA